NRQQAEPAQRGYGFTKAGTEGDGQERRGHQHAERRQRGVRECVTQRAPGEGGCGANALLSLAEEVRSRGGIDAVDRHGGDIDDAIGGRVDAGGGAFSQADEKGLIDVVVEGDGRAGDGEAEALAEVSAADAAEAREP